MSAKYTLLLLASEAMVMQCRRSLQGRVMVRRNGEAQLLTIYQTGLWKPRPTSQLTL